MPLELLEIREMNFVIEVYSAIMCAVGLVCLCIMLPRGANRRFVLQLYACCLLMCLGDAVAALGRGQAGALATAAVHAGNFLALAAPQCSLAFYAARLCGLFGAAESRLIWWKRAVWAIAVFAIAFIALGGAYSIDASNVYARKPGFWVVSATALAMAAVNLIVLLRHRKALPKRTRLVYLLFSVLPMGAAVFQAFVYGLNVAAIAHLLCLLALYADSTAIAAEDAAAARERAVLKDKELAEARLAAVTSQIRPHFLFNTLDGIYYLVAEDPARAQQAIEEFSSYLRTNLESLGQAGAVPIEKELAHVRTYLELERMSMESLLEFEIDAQAGGAPVAFPRAKAKELFAYLVDRRGAACAIADTEAVLWEGDETKRRGAYIRSLVHDVRATLDALGFADVLVKRRGEVGVAPDAIECDYYGYLAGDPLSIAAYQGEYMRQYSWAEVTLAGLEKNVTIQAPVSPVQR